MILTQKWCWEEWHFSLFLVSNYLGFLVSYQTLTQEGSPISTTVPSISAVPRPRPRSLSYCKLSGLQGCQVFWRNHTNIGTLAFLHISEVNHNWIHNAINSTQLYKSILIICGTCICKLIYLLKSIYHPKINTCGTSVIITRHAQNGKHF